MDRTLTLLLTMVVCALVSCAQTGPKAHWVKDGSTTADYKGDVTACVGSGLEIDMIQDGGYTSVDEGLQNCMAKKGWRRAVN
jgi:hypothetical protein